MYGAVKTVYSTRGLRLAIATLVPHTNTGPIQPDFQTFFLSSYEKYSHFYLLVTNKLKKKQKTMVPKACQFATSLKMTNYFWLNWMVLAMNNFWLLSFTTTALGSHSEFQDTEAFLLHFQSLTKPLFPWSP